MRTSLAILPLIAAPLGPLLGQVGERRWDHMGMSLEVIEGGEAERIVVAGGLRRVHVFSADGDRIRTHEGVVLVGGGDGEYFLCSVAGGYAERDVGSVVASTGKRTAVAVEPPLSEPLRFGHWTHEPILAFWRGEDASLRTLSKIEGVHRQPYPKCTVTLRSWTARQEGGSVTPVVKWQRSSMSRALLFQTVDHLLLVDPLREDSGLDPVLLAGGGEAHHLPRTVFEAREVLREGVASAYDARSRTLHLGTRHGTLNAIDVNTGASRWKGMREHSFDTYSGLRGQPAERFASSLELLEDLDGDGVRDLLVGDAGTMGIDPAVHHVSGATGAFLATWDAQALGFEEISEGLRFVPDFGRRVRSLGRGRGFVLSLVPGWGAGEGVILFVRTDGSRRLVREGEL